MADIYVGLDRGKSEGTEPTTGTTTTAKDVEVVVHTTANTAGISREEVYLLVGKIRRFIIEGGLSGAGVNMPKS